MRGSLQLDNFTRIYFSDSMKHIYLHIIELNLYFSDSKRLADGEGSMGLEAGQSPKHVFLWFRKLYFCICLIPKGWREGKGSWGCCPADAVQGSLQAVTHPRLTPRHRSVATQPPTRAHQIGREKSPSVSNNLRYTGGQDYFNLGPHAMRMFLVFFSNFNTL